MPINLSRQKRFNEKRNISVFASLVDFNDLANGETYQLAQLPKEIVIVNAQVMIHTTFNNGGATGTANLGIGGNDSLVAGADLQGDPNTADGADLSLFLDTGGVLTLAPALAGAAATAGKVLVYVEYVEYTKVTGELTSFVPEA